MTKQCKSLVAKKTLYIHLQGLPIMASTPISDCYVSSYSPHSITSHLLVMKYSDSQCHIKSTSVNMNPAAAWWRRRQIFDTLPCRIKSS